MLSLNRALVASRYLLAEEKTYLTVLRRSAIVTATMNETRCFSQEAGRVGITVVFCLQLVVSLVGNSFIAIVVYKTKSLRKPINFLIVNVAMSDLLFPIFLIPEELIVLYNGPWLTSGPLGQSLCSLVFFSVKISVAVSVQSLVLIAVDRFGAVVFPQCAPLISSKKCQFVIPATWILAVTFLGPSWKLVSHPDRPMCAEQRNNSFEVPSSYRNLVMAMDVLFLDAPLILICIIYLVIAFKIKSQKILIEQSANARGQRLQREQNVLKMSIAIMLGFAVCWLPYSIVVLYPLDIKASCGIQYFTGFAFILANSYCAINPFICFVFCGNYRRGLKRLFSCFYVGQRVDEIAS